MVFILGANSLFQAINSLPKSTRNWYKSTVFSLPGLSLNPFAVNERKTVQYQLDNVFRHKTDVIIWHDAINNSLTYHRTNNFRALAFSELSKVLEIYQTRLKAIVYCPRNGAPNIFGFLKQTDVLTIHVLIDLVSKRKHRDPKLVKEYYQLHQKVHLELKSLTLILTHQKSLRRLLKKTRRSKLNKRRRRVKKNKKLAAEVALTSSLHWVLFLSGSVTSV